MATQIRGTTQIKSGTIANAQIASDAAIAYSKLASMTSGYILLGNSSNVPTATAVSGDISISNTGVTAIASGVIVNADINASAAIDTSKLADGANFLKKDGTVTLTGDLNAGSQKITSLANGTNSGDAVNKGQLDAAIAAAVNGLDVKASCRAATTANITLSGEQTIDGVSVVTGDRVLVKNQDTASANGIYVAASGSWARSTDADGSGEVTAGLFTFITEGTANADTSWLLTTNDSITIGSTSLTFTQFASAGLIVAGSGLTKTGNTLDVVSANGGIVVNSDNIALTVDATADSLSVGSGGIKLKDGTSGQIYVADGSGVFKRVSISGDASLANDGTLTVSATGLSPSDFVFNEAPTGSINGSNTAFALGSVPETGTVTVYLNGLLQQPGGGNDYTISGDDITFAVAPQTGDIILCNYIAA